MSGANTTVTGVSGAGLTWSLIERTNTQAGTSEIWKAYSTNKLTNVSVTATLSQSVFSSMTIRSYQGAIAIGAVGSGNANPGPPTASLTTTAPGSWVIGVGNDWDTATSRTPALGQTIINQFLTSLGDTYWVQDQTAPTQDKGTVVMINDTAPTGDRYNLSLVEVLAAPSASPTPSPSPTPCPTYRGWNAKLMTEETLCPSPAQLQAWIMANPPAGD